MTAPTLPGAAPDPAPGRNDPARLPEDVERALQAAASAQVAFGIDVSAENATTTINAWQALRAAIAAHVAPPVSASFEESLTGLDVEAVERRDNGVTVHEIVGLDDVRAAHRAEVDAAVRAEREACARVVEKAYIDRPAYNGGDSPEWVSSNETRRVAAAIRARGAKS